MMKMYLLALSAIIFSLSTSYADAFSAATNPSRPIRPDASAAVEEALKVTAAFGIESKEARVAWDIVEEMDSSDNRYEVFSSDLMISTKNSLDSFDDHSPLPELDS
jgi:hypothetical protein